MAQPDLAFLRQHTLVVYSFQGCPDCQRLKRWLSAQAIAHEEIDIHAHPAAAQKLEDETGKQAVPFLLVDGRTWVRGYHKELPGRFDPRLLLEELRLAVA